jgi:hypothetical protein
VLPVLPAPTTMIGFLISLNDPNLSSAVRTIRQLIY